MFTSEQTLQNSKYEDEILELIERQLKNDDNSYTQSDLQSKVSVIVRNIRNGE